MPGDTRPVIVDPYAGSPIKYGFKTNVDQSFSALCGHIPLATGSVPGIVFGANAPKPGRATRRRDSGIIDSTYYSWATLTTLRSTANVSYTSPRRRVSNRQNRRSRPVKVQIASIDYAWNMPLRTFNDLGGALTQLGVEPVTSSDTNLVWGASKPKPPVASFMTTSGRTRTTFISPTRVNNLPEGWVLVRDARYV